MAIRDWSTTATGNASAASINWAEGQAPSTVNNSAREMMAQIRQEYTSERWGWVAQSGTASVASQTTVKVAGDITTDAVQYRRIKLTGGSTTVYANIVSSSYTSETTITLENATGSLSASHQIAWLAANYDKTIPSDVLRGSSSTTFTQAVAFLESASFSASVKFTGQVAFFESVSFSASVNFAGKAAFNSSASFSGSVNFLGAVNFTGGGVVSSATLSVAAGMLTVGGSPVTGGSGGTYLGVGNGAHSGSWSAITQFIGRVQTTVSGTVTALSETFSVFVYTDGGTTPVLSGQVAYVRANTSGTYLADTSFAIHGNGTTQILLSGISANINNIIATNGHVGGYTSQTATSSSGAIYINCVRIAVGGTTVGATSGVFLSGT